MTWDILQGDCLEVLRTIPDESVNTCVTSPPYWGLRDYGVDGQLGAESTPEEYVAHMLEVFREVKRVLRRDGTCWLNLGDSYARDPKRGVKFQNTKATYLTNRQADEGNRGMAIPTGLKEKDMVGIPWRVAFALQADGWYLRSDTIEEVELYCPCGCGHVLEERVWRYAQDRDIVWKKPNPMPESVRDRPTRSHEYIFLLSKSPKYYYDYEAIKEDAVNGDPNQPRGSVGVVDNKLNGGRRKQDEVGKRQYTGFNERYFSQPPLEKRNKRSVWTVSTKPFSDAHFATFPPDLIEPCILAGCPEGGTVLDPFNGAGTTGLVALRHNRNYLGIELNPEYVEMSKRRIVNDAPLLNAITPE